MEFKNDFFNQEINCDTPCGVPRPDIIYPQPPIKRQIINEELLKQIEADESDSAPVEEGEIDCVETDFINPPNVTATNEEVTGFIIINWTEVPDAMGYEIYRDSQTAPIKIVGPDVFTFRDTETFDTLEHSYWVRSFKYYRDWPI